MLAGAALLASPGLTGCSDGAASTGDVVIQGADVKVTAGTLAAAGQEVVFGPAVVENTGSSVATLRDARLIGDVPATSAEVVDLRVKLLSAQDGDLVGAAIWPFEDFPRTSVELEGFELEPGEEAELLYVVRLGETGTWDWPRSALTYEVDGQRHEVTAETGLRICPPGTADCARSSS